MSNQTKNLNKVLGVLEADQEMLPVKHEPSKKELDENDAEFVALRIRELVEHGVEAAEELKGLATDTQEPRAYEVLAKLIKDTSDAAKMIIDIKKTKKEIEVLDVKINSGGTDSPTNNTTFVFGTMADMLKQIKASTDVPKAEEIIDNGTTS